MKMRVSLSQWREKSRLTWKLLVLCWGRPSRASGQMNENKSRVVFLCQMLIKTKPSGTVAFPRFESTGGHSAIAVNRPSFSSVWVCCVRVIQCVDSNDSMILVCVLVFPMLKWIGVVVSLRIGCVVSCCDVQCLPNMLRHLFCKLSSPSCVICLFQRNVLPVFAYFVLFVTSLFRILFFRINVVVAGFCQRWRTFVFEWERSVSFPCFLSWWIVIQMRHVWSLNPQSQCNLLADVAFVVSALRICHIVTSKSLGKVLSKLQWVQFDVAGAIAEMKELKSRLD